MDAAGGRGGGGMQVHVYVCMYVGRVVAGINACAFGIGGRASFFLFFFLSLSFFLLFFPPSCAWCFIEDDGGGGWAADNESFGYGESFGSYDESFGSTRVCL